MQWIFLSYLGFINTLGAWGLASPVDKLTSDMPIHSILSKVSLINFFQESFFVSISQVILLFILYLKDEMGETGYIDHKQRVEGKLNTTFFFAMWIWEQIFFIAIY